MWQAEKANVAGTQHIKEEIDKVKLQMEEARRRGDWQKMSELQYGKLPQLEAQLKKEDKKLAKGEAKKPQLLRTQVGAEEIAEVVSRATGIPVSKMMQGERDKLLHMEDALHRRVVGQDEAVRLVSDAIRRSRSGLADPNRPYGSFLFLGPTGVGKTELCKALAEFLFDSEQHLIRIDMSEFQERHSVARLIGAPPGYVGYEEGGHLTELVRRKPYSVILLDEVEKAHPDVFNVLLQVLDDGRMTDGQGRTVDFKNTVIVMTSNLGSHKIQQMTDAGDGEALIKIAVLAEVKSNFRPEFVNRIDEIVVFHPLGEAQIADIAKIQMKALESRLAKLEIRLSVSDAALKAVAAAGFDPVYGARPLKRAIQQQIENPLAREILSGKFAAGDTVKVGVDRRRDHVREGLSGGVGAATNGAALRGRRRSSPISAQKYGTDWRRSAVDAERIAARRSCARVSDARWPRTCTSPMWCAMTQTVALPCASTSVRPPRSIVNASPASSTMSRVSCSSVSHSVPRVTRSVVPRAPSSLTSSFGASSQTFVYPAHSMVNLHIHA